MLCKNPVFNNGAAPFTPALPPRGAGAYATMPNYLSGGLIRVQVIQHYRNRGMPQRRGRRLAGAPKSVFKKYIGNFYRALFQCTLIP